MTFPIEFIGVFFKPQTLIKTLKVRDQPKLYIPSDGSMSRCWDYTRLLPAFRMAARVNAFVIRLMALLPSRADTLNQRYDWPLGDYVKDVLPSARTPVVLMGTSGPEQSVIVQIWDENRIIGYVKYGANSIAVELLENEHRILKILPGGLGPAPLKYGAFLNGAALVSLPVPGRLIPARLPPPDDLEYFLRQLEGGNFTHIEDHPYTAKVIRNDSSGELCRYIEPLASRRWPVVLSHGDLAPWNLLRSNDGQIRAVDWEYADREGIPFMDTAYFILQVGKLVYRWPPERTRQYAIEYLTRKLWPGLNPQEAEAIVNLTKHAMDQRSKKIYAL